MTTEERTEVIAAFEQAGFRTISHGMRALALSFARSTRVRDAVAEWHRENYELAA